MMRKTRNEQRILVGKFLGKRSVGGLKSRWNDNIKMDLGRCYEIGKRMELTQDRVPAYYSGDQVA
jgi:hypothetical protein